LISTKGSPTALYHELNQRYFGGRLPRFRVTFTQPRVSGWHGEIFPARRLIRLRRGLTGDELRRTLLHEMCHIGAPHHGQRFQAKLARLVAQGEAWAQQELEIYQQPQLTWTKLIAEVKETLEEFAYHDPRPSFTAIRRYAADTLTCQPGEVLRKAPWLQAAWRNVCHRVDRRRALRAQGGARST
jgi:WLM domain